jgi:hypothetical protein
MKTWACNSEYKPILNTFKEIPLRVICMDRVTDFILVASSNSESREKIKSREWTLAESNVFSEIICLISSLLLLKQLLLLMHFFILYPASS